MGGAVTVLLLVLGLAGGAWGTQAALPPAGVFDLGTMVVGSTSHYSFVMANETKTAIRVTNVESSCECLAVLQAPGDIEPGGAAPFDVRVVGQQVGDYAYELRVGCTDAVQPRRVFVLNVSVTNAATGGPAKRDQGLYVSADALIRDRTAEAEAAFVDIRDGRAFAEAHVPGSVNVPLYAVKATGFLQFRPVVLVDEGWGGEHVEKECRRLRRDRFKSVAILEGGLNAWRSRGGKLEGSRPEGRSLMDIRAADFMAVRGFEDWIVVDTGGSERSGSDPLGDCVSVPYPGEGATGFRSAVVALATRRGRFTRILVVDEDERRYEAMRPLLERVDGAAVYFFSGGRKGLDAQLALLAAMKKSGHERTGRQAAAGSGARVLRKPCGSCP